MLDRIIQDIVASFCSWRVDMGMISPPHQDNRPRVTAQTPIPPTKPVISKKDIAAEDPEYYRIMSRYPEHMLYCPQTSLYPIFFYIMERWEARKAAQTDANIDNASPSNPVPSTND